MLAPCTLSLALAFASLAEDGQLALDDRVAKHLAGWPEVWSATSIPSDR
ncbi:MAG: hypothetical protein AAGI22_30155 [Planctomycetota bacterium]